VSEPVRLVAMRLIDMVKAHPGQVAKACAFCGAPVGIYPSGQKALREHPEAEIMCLLCAAKSFAPDDISKPAGSIDAILQEMRDSTPVAKA
jgi:hypothetical protein